MLASKNSLSAAGTAPAASEQTQQPHEGDLTVIAVAVVTLVAPCVLCPIQMPAGGGGVLAVSGRSSSYEAPFASGPAAGASQQVRVDRGGRAADECVCDSLHRSLESQQRRVCIVQTPTHPPTHPPPLCPRFGFDCRRSSTNTWARAVVPAVRVRVMSCGVDVAQLHIYGIGVSSNSRRRSSNHL